jgi:hypothetical protein
MYLRLQRQDGLLCDLDRAWGHTASIHLGNQVIKAEAMDSPFTR